MLMGEQVLFAQSAESKTWPYSFERPSAIQQRAIVPVVKGHDVIAQAQSGTGKTATFSISILQQVSIISAWLFDGLQ